MWAWHVSSCAHDALGRFDLVQVDKRRCWHLLGNSLRENVDREGASADESVLSGASGSGWGVARNFILVAGVAAKKERFVAQCGLSDLSGRSRVFLHLRADLG